MSVARSGWATGLAVILAGCGGDADVDSPSAITTTASDGISEPSTSPQDGTWEYTLQFEEFSDESVVVVVRGDDHAIKGPGLITSGVVGERYFSCHDHEGECDSPELFEPDPDERLSTVELMRHSLVSGYTDPFADYVSPMDGDPNPFRSLRDAAGPPTARSVGGVESSCWSSDASGLQIIEFCVSVDGGFVTFWTDAQATTQVLRRHSTEVDEDILPPG